MESVPACVQVYKGDQHPHQAQKPMDITDRINGRW